MAEVLFEGNGITSLESVDKENDFKPRPWLNINPPPRDGRCSCCKRHISQLKPFGKAGDPLVGDFNGALLIKTYRCDFPPDEEAEKIMDEFYQDCHSEEDRWKAIGRLIERYGKEEAENIQIRASMSSQVGSFWLCRDCIILDEDEFYEKLFPGFKAKKDAEEDEDINTPLPWENYAE
jgi:hypothetical protein